MRLFLIFVFASFRFAFASFLRFLFVCSSLSRLSHSFYVASLSFSFVSFTFTLALACPPNSKETHSMSNFAACRGICALQASVISFPDSSLPLCRQCNWCCNYRTDVFVGIAGVRLLTLCRSLPSDAICLSPLLFACSSRTGQSSPKSPNLAEKYSNQHDDCNNSER
jgi:hypothetical protein